MPFTTAPPERPIPPPLPTVWIDGDGRLTREAQDFILKLEQYFKALNAHLVAMAAAIP